MRSSEQASAKRERKERLVASARSHNERGLDGKLASVLAELDPLMGDLEYIRFCTELETAARGR